MGFTMIEIALAISIMAIGLVAILGIMPALLHSNRHAIESSKVAMIAQSKMDELNAANDTPAGLAAAYDETYTLSNESLTNDTFVVQCLVTNWVSHSINPTNGVLIPYRHNEYNTTLGITDPILIMTRVTYSWPPNADPKFQQTFTFYTERVAKYEITIP